MALTINEIHEGDCLELASGIESGSVDLILTDLPYGNMAGAALDGWEDGKTAWDIAIDPARVYEIANRILRKNGKMVLFSQEPYTTRLINEANPNVPFSYRAVWEKDHFANSLIAKKAMVGYYEDILIFSKTHDTDAIHPLRPYFAEVLSFIDVKKSAILTEIGQRADHVFRTSSTQFSLCTEQTYNDIVTRYGIDRLLTFKPYAELKEVDDAFKKDLPSVFNLWEGGKYKSNILRYKKDYSGFHPTQKPVLLLEDLIKTFSNEGDMVVDLTAGSGSTLVAALNTSRNFIGIEKDSDYARIARERVHGVLV